MSVSTLMVSEKPFGDWIARITEDIRRNRITLLAALNLNLGDALSTHVGLAAGLPEGNPIPATLIASGGEVVWLFAKFGLMMLVVLLVCLLGRRYPKLWHTFVVSNVVLLVAIVSNLGQILAQ